MASLDDIYDAIDILDKSGVEYLLISIQKGKSQGKADIFYNFQNDTSLKILTKGLKLFGDEIKKKKDNGEFN